MESARRDLEGKKCSFEAAYGKKPLALLEFHAPGLGPTAMRSLIERFNRRRPLASLLGRTIGFLAPTETGAVYRVLVRKESLKSAVLAMRFWRQVVARGFVRFRRVAGWARAIDIACELRVQAEQSVFLLVAEGSLSPEQGRAWIAETLEEDAPRARVRRIVYGPGFCKASEAVEARVTFGSKRNDETVDPIVAPGWEPCRVCGDPKCGQRDATTRSEAVLTYQAIEREVRRGRLLPVYDHDEHPLAYVPVADANYLVRRGLRPVYSPNGRVVGLRRDADREPPGPYQNSLEFDG